MENNIKALQLIGKDYATLFLKEALRHYSRQLAMPGTVSLVPSLADSFQSIARSYLAWESQDLNRELEIIDSQDQNHFQGLLLMNGANKGSPDWERIEDKAHKGL